MIRNPQNAAAGAFLIALGLFALWQATQLTMGDIGHFGPGMLPRALAVLTLLCGAILFAGALAGPGPALERWTLRAPVAILGAAVAFGLCIRPLGLTVAGMVAILIAACAERDARWGETIVFGALMTAFCVGLFRYVLNLPIPVAPWLLGY